MRPNHSMTLFDRFGFPVIVCGVVAMVATSSLHAQECDASLFPGDVTKLDQATVSTSRTWFYRGELPECPSAGERCRRAAYLVQGNTVLSGHRVGAYICAAFIDGKRQATGWLKAEVLQRVPWTAGTEPWTGNWVKMDGRSTIRVSRHNGNLHADALAVYAISIDNVRTGVASGTMKIVERAGEKIAILVNSGNTECTLTLRQNGALLLVDDGVREDSNSPCGGMGVTLSGVYRKREVR